LFSTVYMSINQAHNLKVVASNPTPATNKVPWPSWPGFFIGCVGLGF